MQSLSANDIRDRLVTIATDVLESHNQINGPKSKIYGELRDSLQNKEGKDGSINGGNVAETALKHGSELSESSRRIIAHGDSQDWATEQYSCHSHCGL